VKPVWLEVAEGELGQEEVRGGENPRIVEYHDATTLHAKEDEVPWCSSFVNWCFQKSGLTGTRSAAARSWLEWGDELEKPRAGCVCVIRARSAGEDVATGSATGYHVGFWIAETPEYVMLLGGNQSDRVKTSIFKKSGYNVKGCRWPTIV
jgi:uncharacterized protein (TIGR02594 family)